MKPHFITPHIKIVKNNRDQGYDIVEFHDNGWTYFGWEKVKHFKCLNTAKSWARNFSKRRQH